MAVPAFTVTVRLLIFTCGWVIVSATMNLDIYLESFTDVLNHTSITEIPNGSNNIVPALFHLCVQPLQKYTQGNRCPYGEVTIAPNPTTSFGHNNMIRFRDFATIGDFQLQIEVYYPPLSNIKTKDVFSFKLPRSVPVHSVMYPFSVYTGIQNGRKLCVRYKVTTKILSGACSTKHCQLKSESIDVRLRRQSNDQRDDKLSIGVILGIVFGIILFVLYILLLPTVIAVFVFCFVRFNCNCVKCCGLKGCYQLKCSSLKCVRKPRVGFPKAVSNTATIFCNKCCPCCSDIDTWDSGELGFWLFY